MLSSYNNISNKVEIKEGKSVLKMVKENTKDMEEANIKIGMIEDKVLEKMKQSFRRDRRL